MSMAQRIRQRRVELGLNQADLAAICDVSITAVMKWEHANTHNLKNEHLFVLADALNVSPRWLALGEGKKVASSDREAYQFALRKSQEAVDREQQAWHRIAAAFSRAVVLALVLILSLPHNLSEAATTLHNQRANGSAPNSLIYYTFSGIRRWLARFAGWFAMFRTGQLSLR